MDAEKQSHMYIYICMYTYIHIHIYVCVHIYYISTEISMIKEKVYKCYEGGLKILQKNRKQKLSTGGAN